MRKPKLRARRLITGEKFDELVELFRKAMPGYQAHWKSIVTRREMLYAKFAAAVDAVQAFHLAAGVRPWQHTPLSPRTDLPALRAALLAKCSDAERKAWDRFSRKYED
jgi:hypothetical protein